MDGEESIPEKEIVSWSGYDGLTHCNVGSVIPEALKQHEENRLRHTVEDRCKKVVLALFEESQEYAKNNVYAPIFEFVQKLVRLVVELLVGISCEKSFDCAHKPQSKLS